MTAAEPAIAPEITPAHLAGDGEAWDALVRAHQQPVFRFAYLLLGDADDAGDVTQDTFLRAMRGIHTFDRTRPLRPWLLSICANLASNRKRAWSRRMGAMLRWWQAQPPAQSIAEQGQTNLEAQRMWGAVRALKESEFEKLRHYTLVLRPNSNLVYAINPVTGMIAEVDLYARTLEHTFTFEPQPVIGQDRILLSHVWRNTGSLIFAAGTQLYAFESGRVYALGQTTAPIAGLGLGADGVVRAVDGHGGALVVK